mmetsp:Transcript_35626/g.69904  ORF Transcript_35626/g.69904 Transcript_35626/m.69904 type:complete len:218 (-) Transcript_35626:17-670(-)
MIPGGTFFLPLSCMVAVCLHPVELVFLLHFTVILVHVLLQLFLQLCAISNPLAITKLFFLASGTAVRLILFLGLAFGGNFTRFFLSQLVPSHLATAKSLNFCDLVDIILRVTYLVGIEIVCRWPFVFVFVFFVFIIIPWFPFTVLPYCVGFVPLAVSGFCVNVIVVPTLFILQHLPFSDDLYWLWFVVLFIRHDCCWRFSRKPREIRVAHSSQTTSQ